MSTPEIQRLQLSLRGAVQGVGFRPFVYRLAHELALTGWIRNTTEGVVIEVEGGTDAVHDFLLRVHRDKPVHASIQGSEPLFLDPAGYRDFTIHPSSATGAVRAHVLPDIATCAECLHDIRDPENRRYGYPFTNCTNCGPRYTIIRQLPYDRPNTSMARFTMCAACRREYDDPSNRRFHAQPNACPDCGPQLELRNNSGASLAVGAAALAATVKAVRAGRIAAVKGIGGYHLVVDAANPDAVQSLREHKAREEKPFALMYPDLATVERDCDIDAMERRLLASPEAPIVLLRRRSSIGIADNVAPGNPTLGVMLPSNPLHHLLLDALAGPVVATSGNLRDEPICIDEDEAQQRLGNIADVFLDHDRPIVRHVDDSIARVMMERELILRRARGYAPLPISLESALAPTLAVGAHLKNSVAITSGDDVFLSQHIGDLETAEAYDAFTRQAADLQGLFDTAATRLACDLHPDYLSSRYAEESDTPAVAVQHHFAHVVACMAENHLDGTVLGVAWDGSGLGADRTVWGGEFLTATLDGFTRTAWLRPFPLPGGDAAAREPRRSALGLLHKAGWLDDPRLANRPIQQAFTPEELNTIRTMLDKSLNCPLTSSAGRLFDGIASLLGLRQISTYEGQAAMQLEFAVDTLCSHAPYPMPVTTGDEGFIVDWIPLLDAVLDDRAAGTATGEIAARFHLALAAAITEVARRADISRVVLSGGCFQNRYLLESTSAALKVSGFQVYWHQRVPPNDGGIALGQAVHVARQTTKD